MSFLLTATKLTADSTATADSLANAPIDTTQNLLDTFVEVIQRAEGMSGGEILDWGIRSVIEISATLLFAAGVFIVGRWLIRRLTKWLRKIFLHHDVDISLSKFIVSMVRIVLHTLLIFSVISILGINTTSFLAIFGAVGLAIGMALSGTLQNFAGGVLILVLKPFKVGDYIEAQSYAGTVKEISLFSTLLNTIDNKMIILPNGPLSTGTINNASMESTRRCDWIVSVAYGTDFNRAKEIIIDEINRNEKVIHDPEVAVLLKTLDTSSVNIEIRAWCHTDDYWPLKFEFNEAIYRRFNDEGVEFPFPQLDVHIKKGDH